MTQIRTKLILWTGKKHSGKTTSAAKLAKIARNEGFTVAGLLAPCLYHNGRLIGFDAFDLQSENRAPLARRNTRESETQPFTFIADGLKLGSVALSPIATESSDLIIVDEFGPLELDRRGWRKNVDSLLGSSDALIVLVVRHELVETVKKLYKDVPCIEIAAGEQNSIDQVITLLQQYKPAVKPPAKSAVRLADKYLAPCLGPRLAGTITRGSASRLEDATLQD